MFYLCADDYIDEDVAYILGMVLMRGALVAKSPGGTLTIKFPHRLDTVRPPDGYDLQIDRSTALELSLHRLGDLMQEVLGVPVRVTAEQGQATVVAEFDRNTVAWRNINALCGHKRDYSEFELPEVVFECGRDIQLSVMRGIADCSADPSAKDNAWGGSQRIVLQFQHSNWVLPVQVCRLLQTKLGVRVQHVLWGHPNVRGPAGGGSWAKEHRLRILAEEFQPIGFQFEYKQRVLEALIDWNKNHPGTRPRFCNPKAKTSRQRKPKHPDETSETLPAQVRRHFNSACAICKALGCSQGRRSQMQLFEEDEQ